MCIKKLIFIETPTSQNRLTYQKLTFLQDHCIELKKDLSRAGGSIRRAFLRDAHLRRADVAEAGSSPDGIYDKDRLAIGHFRAG